MIVSGRVPSRRKAVHAPASVRRIEIALALGLLGIGQPAQAQDAEETPVQETIVEEPLVRGLSWDIMAAGIPSSGAIGQVELGFTGLPRIAYHYTLEPGMSLGGMVGFDYGLYVPKNVFGPNIFLAVPIRYRLYKDETMSFAVRADPGLRFGFNPGFFGIQAALQAILGFPIENRFVIGAALELPITFGIYTQKSRRTRAGGDDVESAFLLMPLLLGPVAEFHVTPPLAITLDAKFGPSFDTQRKIRFAMKIHAGAALRF